jgi:hypothetical protein
MLSDVGRIIRTTSRHASVERRKQASVAAVAVLSQSSRGSGRALRSSPIRFSVVR